MNSAANIIEKLDLSPHPEGGWYRQTWLSGVGERPTGSAIYYLLEAGERSHWHWIDSTEIWHFHAGAPLRLQTAKADTGPIMDMVLGPDIMNGQHAQVIVPKGHWQAAESLGDWTLVGCTVSPAFHFDGFHMAPPDWHPAPDSA